MSAASKAAELSGRMQPKLEGIRLEPSMATVGDYISLLKPRVMSLVIFTALVGLLVAPGHLHPVIAFTALFCIAVGAGAAGALNMWYDADIDAVMARTAQRPVPAGRIQPGEALGFGMTLAIGSVGTLGLLVNWVAAGLLAFTIFFYVAIYTMWLKRWTPQNIVIVGAAAVTGHIGLESLLLFLIIFIWTPPHFWALSLSRVEEYARAGVPMLPVVAGQQSTGRQILVYSALLVPVGAAPWLFDYAGIGYALTVLAAGAVMVGLAWRLNSASSDELRIRIGKQLFVYSIFYLALVFAALLIERKFGLLIGRLA
jgi:heme o synthase